MRHKLHSFIVVRSISAFVLLVFGVTYGRAGQADEVTLTKDEAAVVKSILVRDQLLREMTASQEGINDLNKVLKMTITGAVKIVVIWDQIAIDAWRNINSKLVLMGKKATCDDIALELVDISQSLDFFRQLARARGCDE